jgi:cytochrome c-type biogenesis protein CcmF
VLSRETLLLSNNVLLVVAMGAVMLGTLYPLILDALSLGKISVGPPYFDTVFVPMMALLVFLMGVGPLARWKQAELPALGRRLRWAAAVAVVSALLTAWAAGTLKAMAVLGLLMSFWIITTLATDLWDRIRPAGGVRANVLHRIGQLPRAIVGMMVAHFGVAAFVFGVTMVSNLQVERDVAMRPGDTTQLRGYAFRFMGVQDVRGPNYQAVRGHLRVTRDGRLVAEMFPEKRFYAVQRMPMTEAAIDPGFTRDLYVALGEVVGGEVWILRVYVKPFIDWIWAGCLLMGLGGLLAVTDRRYRVRATRPGPEVEPAAVGARAA